MKISANCKINLHLKITGRRPDGYHDIETIFQEIALADELVIEAAPDGVLDFSAAGVEITGCDENICQKAARLLNEAAGTSHGCRIRLFKNIPLGAGLGGGSADAAAVLKGLNEIWGLQLSYQELEKIAVKLGADVPFFIRGGAAAAAGIGEMLTPMRPLLRNGWLAIVNPGLHVHTGNAYKNIKYDLTNYKTGRIFATVLENDLAVEELDTLLENDFEGYVFTVHPEVGRIKQALSRAGASFSRMSGSGSTVFGYFQDRNQAEVALEQFAGSWFKRVVEV